MKTTALFVAVTVTVYAVLLLGIIQHANPASSSSKPDPAVKVTSLGRAGGVLTQRKDYKAAVTIYLVQRKHAVTGHAYRLRLIRLVADTPAGHGVIADAVQEVTHDTTYPAIKCRTAVLSLAQFWVKAGVDQLTRWESEKYDRWAVQYARSNGCKILR